MLRCLLCIFFSAFCLTSSAQDTVYARKIIRYLSSETCYGRGYVRDGLMTAANYLAAELKTNGALPLFTTGYFQRFQLGINTFPKKLSVTANGKRLRPGLDFILLPESGSADGRFRMLRKDSMTFVSEKPGKLVASFQRRMMFSVGREAAPYCGIQLNAATVDTALRSLNVRVKNRYEPAFTANNVAAFLPGTIDNDSMIVFTAHYDHLGCMGQVFFPGASDNASGSSFVMNLVAYYKTHPPRYKTLFIFFAGEEAGLVGSKYFVDNRSVDLKKIKFLINLDLLGTGDDGIMVVNGAVHEKEFTLLKTINEEKDLVKDVRKRGKARNSDQYWFGEAGVPAFFIYTLGGHTFYHDVRDTAETLPLTDYVDVMRLLTAFVERL